MKKHYLLILCTYFAFYSTAQKLSSTDSLKAKVQTAVSPKEKVDLLNKLAYAYQYISFDTSLVYARQAFNLSHAENYTLGKADAARHLGKAFFKKRKNDSAIIYNDLSFDLYTTLNNQEGLAKCQHQIALTYYPRYDFEKVLAYHLEGLKISEEANHSEGLSEAYTHLGIFYSNRGDYDKSLKYHKKSLHISRQAQNLLMLGINYINIGVVYFEKENYLESLSWLQKAEKIIPHLGKLHHAVIANNIGEIYLYLYEYDKAYPYLDQALQAYKKIGDEVGSSFVMVTQAKIHLKKSEFEKAIKVVRKFLENSIKINEAHSTKEGYKILADAYAHLNDYKKAFTYSLLYDSVQNKLSKTILSEKVSGIQNQYENEKKDNQILLLQHKNIQNQAKMAERKILILYLILSALVIIAIMIWFFSRYHFRQRKKQLLLEQANNMANKQLEFEALKSKFFANISHEFRTPLTLILTPLEEKLNEVKDVREYAQVYMMVTNAKKLLTLINQLLDLSKAEHNLLKVTLVQQDMVPVILNTARAFSPLAEQKNISFEIKTDFNTLITKFDPQTLEIIITNLLANAFKNTPEKGRITLCLEKDEKMISIHIKDTGRGIPEKDLPYIFKRFYQVPSTHSEADCGTGIGLSITHEYVKLHQGYIDVSSEVNKGTYFTVYLPILCDNQPSLAERKNTTWEKNLEPPTTPECNTSKKGKKLIVLIEDNIEVQTYISYVLSEHFRVIVAVNGEDGKEKIINSQPDLIISDIRMPIMSGIGLAKELKSNLDTCHIPIIFLTAKASSDDKVQGLELGVDDYLTKPFVTRELIARCENLITRRRQLRELFSKNIVLEPQKVSSCSVDEKFLKKIFGILEDHLSEPHLDVTFLCQEMGMSRSSLHNKLTALTSLSTTKFIRSYRLKKAAQYLEQHTGSIIEIAYSVGFNNPQYFIKSFKEEFKITPSDYKSRFSSQRIDHLPA